MNHSDLAEKLFLEGYNCSQAVLAAFEDVTGISRREALLLSSSFGGGMGRLREVCGAVSGMFFVLSALYGYDTPGDDAAKKRLYADVQALAQRFRAQCGSIICREILKNPPTDPNPTPRTEEFYKTRPCARMVLVAARLLDEYIAGHPVETCHG